jgi:hypothetical protein
LGITEKGLLAADERRWTRISDGKRFVFNLRSSAANLVLAFFRTLVSMR